MPNPVVHFEFGCRDRDKTVEFYKQLFDWQMSPGEISTEIATGAGESVTGHIVSLGHEPHNYTNFYVQVANASEALVKAESLGGKILIPPIPLPDGSGLFAWFADPEGNTVGIVQRKTVGN